MIYRYLLSLIWVYTGTLYIIAYISFREFRKAQPGKDP